MKRLVTLSLVAVVLAHSSVTIAQAPSATAATAPAAKSNDVASADAIISALYDANSVMVDQKKDMNRFRSLFVPDARLMPTAGGPIGRAVLRTQSVEEYVKGASAGPPRGGFSEREIARTAETFGPIMQVFSTYETHRNSTDPNLVRGINSIQLFNDGTRWWVVSVLWAAERADTKIPAAYLKSPGKTP